MQRPRNRCRRERQHIDPCGKLLDPFLLSDTETLLLVHNQEAEVPEAHALPIENCVRTDQDVHAPVRHLMQCRRLFTHRAKAADHIHFRRKLRKTRNKCLIVLLRKHGCRHENSNLKPIHRCLERRTHGNLRLAKAHIATEQAIHRLLALHVALDLCHGTQLIVRLLVGKRLLKLTLHRIVRRKGMPLGKLTLRVDLKQVIGDVLHGFLCLCARPRPVCRPHTMQTRGSPL